MQQRMANLRVAVAIADDGSAAGGRYEDMPDLDGELDLPRIPDASMKAKKEPRRSGALRPCAGQCPVYFEEPPDAPPEVEPPIEPLPLGEVVEPLECGAELLPEELLGPQSSIAVVLLLLPLALVPPLLFELGLLALGLGLVVPLAPALLELGLFAAELLPGGQSLLDIPPEPPDIEPLVPALVPDLSVVAPVDPVAPVVPLVVCAIAAVPRVSAMIDAAVRRRRFIRSPPLKSGAPPGERPVGTLDR